SQYSAAGAPTSSADGVHRCRPHALATETTACRWKSWGPNACTPRHVSARTCGSGAPPAATPWTLTRLATSTRNPTFSFCPPSISLKSCTGVTTRYLNTDFQPEQGFMRRKDMDLEPWG